MTHLRLSLAATILMAASAPASAQTTPCSPLVEEAWAAVSSGYLDPSFNGVDWGAARPADGPCPGGDPHDQVRRLLDRLDDPAVRLVPAPRVEDFLGEMMGRPHVGVGLRELLSVDVDERTRLLTVVTPVPDGPAARAGLRTGDVIEAIDGVRSDTLDLALAMGLLRGEEGTPVALTLRRGDRTEGVTLRRRRIEPPPKAVVRLHAGPAAWVRVPDFSEGTAAVLDSALLSVEAAGATGVVLDLRDNPGGLVQELMAAAALFLDPGTPVARLRSRPGADTLLAVDEGRAPSLIPLAVLVNGGTASAAEALAGALQAAGRARLVGERTFGKGLAHAATPLSDGSLVLAPMGRLETPGGRDILDEGIVPDVIVDSPTLATLMPALDSDDAFAAAVALLSPAAARHPDRADGPSPAELLFADDFEEGVGRWRFPLGSGHALVETGDEARGAALALQVRGQPVYALMRGSDEWGDVRIEGEVLFPAATDNYLGFIWRYRDDGRRIDFGSLYIKGNGSYVQANPHHDTNVGRTVFPELRVPLDGDAAISIGEWMPFALEVVGATAHLYVGGSATPVFAASLPAPERGAFGFKPRNPGGAVWIDDVRVRPIGRLSSGSSAPPEASYPSERHVRSWRVLGPLTRTVPEIESGDAFGRGWSIMDDGRRVGWRDYAADPRGAVLTGWVTDYRGSRKVAYFHTTLEAEAAGDVVLEWATADDLAIWLNGEFVGFASRQPQAWWDAGEHPGHAPLRAAVSLRRGRNELVARVVGGTYATGGFFLAVRR